MKRNILKYVIIFQLFTSVSALYSESPNYDGGNGAILKQVTENGTIKTLRKHEQRVQIGDMIDKENRDIFDSYDNESKTYVHRLTLDEYIDIYQLYSEKKH